MAGTHEGGIKTRDKNLAIDPDHYRKMGRLGGKKTGRKGFAIDNRTFWQKLFRRPTRAQLAGRKGGYISRRRSNGTPSL